MTVRIGVIGTGNMGRTTSGICSASWPGPR